MKPIKWVKQEDAKGCVIACIAMVMGREYQDVKNDFLCFDSIGSEFTTAFEYLAEHGYAVALKYSRRHWQEKLLSRNPWNLEQKPRESWPPEPFAEVHLCNVDYCEGAPMCHAVVMLADGTVLDPYVEGARKLTDYPRVYSVAAVIPFSETEVAA